MGRRELRLEGAENEGAGSRKSGVEGVENEEDKERESRMEGAESEGGGRKELRMEGLENEGSWERKLRMEGRLSAETLKTELTPELTQGRRGEAVEIHRAVAGAYSGSQAAERMIIKAGIEGAGPLSNSLT